MNFTHTHTHTRKAGVSRVNLYAYLLDSISFTARDPNFPHVHRQIQVSKTYYSQTWLAGIPFGTTIKLSIFIYFTVYNRLSLRFHYQNAIL